MEYQSYYNTPGVRDVCHAVKQVSDISARRHAVEIIAAYFIEIGVVDEDSVLIPIPQHTGRSEYTLEIARAVAKATGAKVADIVRCQPHEPLYDRKLEGYDDLGFFLDGDVPERGKLFLVDNVIGTGKTFFSVAALLGRPAAPLVYAIDDTRFERWGEMDERQ